MGKYSKKLLDRVQEHNLKKILDETGNLGEIQDRLKKIGLGEFVSEITEDVCAHRYRGQVGRNDNEHKCNKCGKVTLGSEVHPWHTDDWI